VVAAAAEKPKIAVIYYSTYGHNVAMKDAIVAGIQETGAEVTVYQVPETLSEEVLGKLGGAPKSDDPVITRELLDTLPGYDGIFFGFPTRFGTMPAQMKAFFDSLGDLWFNGDLNGMPAAIWSTTGTQGGGVETTTLTSLPVLIHLGMIFIPIGYTKMDIQSDMGEIHGGSPYGAHSYAALDGSRMPSEKELALAKHQGTYCGGLMKKFAGK